MIYVFVDVGKAAFSRITIITTTTVAVAVAVAAIMATITIAVTVTTYKWVSQFCYLM